MSPQAEAVLRRRICRRCGHDLARTEADVPVCLHCRHAEHFEIDQRFAGGHRQANDQHSRLLDMALVIAGGRRR